MLNITIHDQPDDETCGPTSLHAVYDYYGIKVPLATVIQEVERLNSGGTLAPFLGTHALKYDFSATIYINNINVFDPSWFKKDHTPNTDIIDKLTLQLQHKDSISIIESSHAYINYLKSGGAIRFCTIDTNLLKQYFAQQIPIITGLSATYLYNAPREIYTQTGQALDDDIQGTPCGHFVVLCGYDEKKRHVIVADSHRKNPISNSNYYKVSVRRLINAIMLGVMTDDGNLIIIQPEKSHACRQL